MTTRAARQREERTKRLRVVGYWDGYAGREAHYVAAEYQQAWRRGAAQARRDRTDGAA